MNGARRLMTNLRPRNNNLTVRRYKKPEQSDGGIWIPEEARYDPNKLLWEVVAVGPGRISCKGHRIACECEEGDIVQSTNAFVACPLDIPYDDLYILCEEDVSHICWRADDDD